MSSIHILAGLRAMASKVGGPAGYLGSAVLGVLEEIVNDFDNLKTKVIKVDLDLQEVNNRIDYLQRELDRLEKDISAHESQQA